MKLTKTSIGLLLVIGLLTQGAGLMAKAPSKAVGPKGHDSGQALAPSPSTLDQITHNLGNIVTTVDNDGYVGGYWNYYRPSGEWPRNSGHNYIGELMYWMGAVLPNGDTLCDNSLDEFQGLPALVSGANDNKIALSTDTSRYYGETGYDPADTVGLGIGNPAHGWRVWDPLSSQYTYQQNYSPTLGSFVDAGPLALQVSNFRFNDAGTADQHPWMNIEVTHTILQWNYCYNENFMYVILEITNKSDTDYTNFAFGLYVDLDVGGFDGTGENGRLNDMVAYDVDENLAWTYDVVGVDPGWGPTVQTGIMGTKYLETPDDIGMTALRTGAWALVPDRDPDRYAMINADHQYDTPIDPDDQYYIQCTNGINLTAGKTVRVVYAIVAGQDEEEFRANASLAQQLYDNYFVGPQPPVTPTLKAQASDRGVYLQWNDTAEVGLDPLSGEQDFVGYKLYRSDNQGKTWGHVNYNTGNDCLKIDYDPISMFTVASPGDPISHSFVDTGLFNGVEYWYCLAAFDKGDTIVGVDPLQSGFGIAGEAANVIAVTPRKDPAGFYDAAGTVEHTTAGGTEPSDGEVYPTVFSRSELTGSDYAVVFEDTPQKTYWHLINTTTGDTVLANQTRTDGDPGLYDVAEGLRVVVRDGDMLPRSMEQTAIGGSGATLQVSPDNFYGGCVDYFYGVRFGSQHTRSTYELRFTGNSTVASAINDGVGMGTAWTLPFEVWNTTDNQRVSAVVYDFGLDGWDPDDLIIIVNYPYDENEDPFDTAWPFYFSWMFGFDAASYNPSTGDVFTIEGAPQNGPDDEFVFKADGVNAVDAGQSLEDIKVVPDPYFVQYSAMVETGLDESILEFQNIPDKCTIRIYTLAGDLVRTIEHNDGSGVARWDLLTSNAQQVASGIYIYHVDSPYGEHLGRFAVVK